MIVAATEGHIITKNLMEAAAVDYGFESLPHLKQITTRMDETVNLLLIYLTNLPLNFNLGSSLNLLNPIIIMIIIMNLKVSTSHIVMIIITILIIATARKVNQINYE